MRFETPWGEMPSEGRRLFGWGILGGALLLVAALIVFLVSDTPGYGLPLLAAAIFAPIVAKYVTAKRY